MEENLKPWAIRQNPFNPNPLTKLLVLGFLGATVVHPVSAYVEWVVIGFISLFYFMLEERKTAVTNLLFFLFLSFFPSFPKLYSLPALLKLFLSFIYVLRMFYLPYAGGRFFIKTSDVGSILASMDYLHIPPCISIPIAVMFRFFPSFAEEKRNISMAMRIRGIKTRNPLRYLEYITVPLLIISANIAEDIAKAAECKCIENPIPKCRYSSVHLQWADFFYALLIISTLIVGWILYKR